MEEREHNQSRTELPSVQHRLLTAEDLWKQVDDGYRYELVKGIIRRMPPVGFEHGILSSKIGSNLDKHIRHYKDLNNRSFITPGSKV